MKTPQVESVREMRLRHREEYRKQSDAHDAEMKVAVRTEFPIGARVKYKHGQNFISAVVDGYPEFSWVSDKVIVKNLKSGNKKEIEAWCLEALA